MSITQVELKAELNYDPLTGIFTWLNDSRKGGFKAGRKCTSKDVHGYIQINVLGKVMKAHRLAWLYMTGEFPKDQIDHINHQRDDNRWCNLKEATNQSNHWNRPRQHNNISGCPGVTYYKNAWCAKITVDGKQIHLGRFQSLEDAIHARKSANKLYGFHENHGADVGRRKYRAKARELEKQMKEAA